MLSAKRKTFERNRRRSARPLKGRTSLLGGVKKKNSGKWPQKGRGRVHFFLKKRPGMKRRLEMRGGISTVVERALKAGSGGEEKQFNVLGAGKR